MKWKLTKSCFRYLINFIILYIVVIMYYLQATYDINSKNTLFDQNDYTLGDQTKQIKVEKPKTSQQSSNEDQRFNKYKLLIKNSSVAVVTKAISSSMHSIDHLHAEIIEKHKLFLKKEFSYWKNIGAHTNEKQYMVEYRGEKFQGQPSRNQLLCALKDTIFRVLKDGDEPFTKEGLGRYFPHQEIFEGRHFNTCAIVSSAGSIIDSSLGLFIDSHDAIVRFNDATTEGYEKDVGSRTTLRFMNQLVIVKETYHFYNSPLYNNVSLLVWRESKYNQALSEFHEDSEESASTFARYFGRRKMKPEEPFYILHPTSIWNSWDVLQKFTDTPLIGNPPSSGFMSLILMLRYCDWVNAIEQIPSVRKSESCHYYEKLHERGCTTGGWHPLAAEKELLTILNTSDDTDTYIKGIASIPGFSQISCQK